MAAGGSCVGSCCVHVACMGVCCWKADMAAAGSCLGSCCVQAANLGGWGSWQVKVLLAYKSTGRTEWLGLDHASLWNL